MQACAIENPLNFLLSTATTKAHTLSIILIKVFFQILMSVTTAYARTEEHASTQMADTDVNVTMDTVERTVI